MRSIPGALAATVAWLLAASVGAASEQPPCKAFDDGTRTRACQSFCNQAFASMHCPFCGCNTCRWCPQSFASSPPVPTASTRMKESVNGNRSALQEKVRVSAVAKNDSFATSHRQRWCHASRWTQERALVHVLHSAAQTFSADIANIVLATSAHFAISHCLDRHHCRLDHHLHDLHRCQPCRE